MANKIKRDFVGISQSFEEKATSLDKADLEMLKAAFMPMALDKIYTGEKYYAAMLAIATLPHIKVATEAIGVGADIRNPEAATIIMDAINNAPKAWLEKHREELYAKGVIAGAEFYHIVHAHHAKGTDFDDVSMKIPASRQPLLAAAIDATYKRDRKFAFNVTDRALIAIAVQLLDDSLEKSEFAKKIDKGFGPNGIAWRKSIEAMIDIAHIIGFDTNSLPNPINPRNKTPVKAAPEPVVVAPDSAAEKMNAEIAALVRQHKIKDSDVKVAKYMAKPLDNDPLRLPSDMHVSSRYSLSFPYVQQLRVKLKSILDPVEKELQLKRETASPKPIEP